MHSSNCTNGEFHLSQPSMHGARQLNTHLCCLKIVL